MKTKLLIILLFFTFNVFSQQEEYILEENHYIHTELDNASYDGNSTGITLDKMNHTYRLPKSFNFSTAELSKFANFNIEIAHDFNLNDQIVELPENSTLIFVRGHLYNYKSLVGNNNNIIAGNNKQIFDANSELSGLWNISESYAEWFGAKGDGITNDHDAIVKSLDLAPTKLLEKTYFTSRIDLKSNQSIVGSGYETILKSKGLILTLGGIDAWSFTENYITYSILENPIKNSNFITLTSKDDISKYQIGEIVALHSEEGYHDGAETFKPMYQQLVKIESLDAVNGKVYIEDKIYKDYNGNEFRISKGSEIKNNNDIPSRLTQNIVVSNLSVHAINDTWSRFGGTYNTRLENINSIKSVGLLIQNGFAKSEAINIHGNFIKKVYDLAFFSHNSTSQFGDCFADEKSKLMFLFGFAEGSHDNTVIAKNIDCTKSINSSLKDVIIFSQGSDNNSLIDSKISVYNAVRIIKSGHNFDVMTYKNNLIKNVDIKFVECSTLIANNSTSAASAELNIESSSFAGNKITGTTVNSNASKLKITKCYFNTPESNIRLSAKSKNSVISENVFHNNQKYIFPKHIDFINKNNTTTKV